MSRTTFLSVLIAFALSGTTFSAELRVPQDYADLQLAMSQVHHGDSIVLDSGAYSGAGFRGLYLSDSLGIVVTSRHGAALTTIDLQDGSFCRSSDRTTYPTRMSTVSGLHFVNGDTAVRYGFNSDLLVANCVFSHCKVGVYADMYASDYVGGVQNCVFENCNTGIYGPNDPWITVTSCLFYRNQVGIYGAGELLMHISNCTFLNNSYAGFENNSYNNGTVDRNVFVGNAFGVISDNQMSYWVDRMHCNNFYGNWWENYGGLPDQTGINGNISLNPHYCDTTTDNLTLASISPLLPSNNGCHQLIGHQTTVACYCGDVDVSGNVDIGDISAIISFLYLNGPAPTPPAAGEIDGISPIDIADLTRLIDYLYISFLPLPCGA